MLRNQKYTLYHQWSADHWSFATKVWWSAEKSWHNLRLLCFIKEVKLYLQNKNNSKF